jgi:uncharacterized protein YggU (UPF0235/DUF167 family)
MTKRDCRLHDGKKGAAIGVRVSLGASNNEIAEIRNDGTICIRLTASVGEEKTNQLLEKFLANILSVPSSQIEIIVGETRLDKIVSIIDMDALTVHNKIIAQTL